MDFLSTDNQECSVDFLLSENIPDLNFAEEIRMILETHDALSEVPVAVNVNFSSSDVTSTSNDSGVVSPGNSSIYDDTDTLYESSAVITSGSSTAMKSDTKRSARKRQTESKLDEIDSKLYEMNHTDKSKKNAIAAKMNREKKKKYVQGLEDQVSSLQLENNQLKHWHVKMAESMSKLQCELRYLKCVLANQSTLSKLLQNIPQIDGVELTTTFTADEYSCLGKRRSSVNGREQHNDAISSKKAKGDSSSEGMAGVCLHVVNNTATLEFCAECSHRSSSLNNIKQMHSLSCSSTELLTAPSSTTLH